MSSRSQRVVTTRTNFAAPKKLCRLANFINNKNAVPRSPGLNFSPFSSIENFHKSCLVKDFYSLVPPSSRLAPRIYLAITSSPDLIECKAETATKNISLLGRADELNTLHCGEKYNIYRGYYSIK